MRITVVGLGPGDPDLLTRAATRALESARLIALRTARHPAVVALPTNVPTMTFDGDYDAAESFDALYKTIVERLLEIAHAGPFVYAVPGHPLVGEETVQRLRRRAHDHNVTVEVVAGLSFIEPALTAIGLDPLTGGLQIADAHEPVIDPLRPAVIAQLYNQRLASATKLALLELYPPEHVVTLIRHAGGPNQSVRALRLFELDRDTTIDHLTCLYVPPLPILEAVGTEPTFKHVVYRLRRECPWDREQTHQSLARYLVEETFEAIDAIDTGDPETLAEELGDVLLQVYLNAAIGEEAETFSLRDVLAHITAKLIRRHPHVFGDTQVSGAAQVTANWEAIKQQERADRPPASVLASVPRAMPAVPQIQQLQQRASIVGFEWLTIDDVWAKLEEELAELRAASTTDERAWEWGDALTVLIDLARWLGLDAETSGRAAARRFRQRFAALEEMTRAAGRPLSAYATAELLALWRDTKSAVR